jgi:Proteasome subunit
MTVLVGIRCKEGIVIGADSAATFSAGQLRTIEQPVKKISIIEDRVIVAGTGEIGLNQRFCAVVRTAWGNKAFRGSSIDVARSLCKLGLDDFSFTSAKQGTYGALVAFPVGNTLELCEFGGANFQPEMKTDDLWYVSMGSGQSIADPCLGFIRQAFWNDGMPSCQDGVFAAVWTLSQAIKLNPGGINAPMHIAMLTHLKGQPSARFLDVDEIDQHVSNVDGAIEHLRQYRATLIAPNAADIPKPKEL